jgi:hypothetical protein
MAQRTASTTLRNSTSAPSPVRYDTTVMHGDRRVDEIASKRPQASQGPILVCAGKSAEANDIRGKDGGKFPALGHSRQFP